VRYFRYFFNPLSPPIAFVFAMQTIVANFDWSATIKVCGNLTNQKLPNDGLALEDIAF